jgi:hypothetical protein
MSDFYETRMGHRFYEHTMPELVKQLERLNELLARLVDEQERRDEEGR